MVRKGHVLFFMHVGLRLRLLRVRPSKRWYYCLSPALFSGTGLGCIMVVPQVDAVSHGCFELFQDQARFLFAGACCTTVIGPDVSGFCIPITDTPCRQPEPTEYQLHLDHSSVGFDLLGFCTVPSTVWFGNGNPPSRLELQTSNGSS